MIDGGAKQRSALKTASELSGKLFHAPNSRFLGHVFAQHLKIFEQDRAFVSERRLKRFTAVNRVFDLTKDPWIGHGAPADQDSIATGFLKPRECLIDSSHIAATGNRHTDGLFDLHHQVPICKPAIALFFGAAMKRDVLDAAGFGQFGSVDRVDGAVRISGADFYCQWDRDRLFDFFKDRFQPWQIAQQSRSTTVLYDFRRGTTAVYVENDRADLFGHLRGHTHALSLAAENLHGERALVFIETHLPFRFRIVAGETFDRDEF